MKSFRKVKSEKAATALIEGLNQHVTNLTDLFIQVKLAHWNVRGPRFIAYHEFFDELAGQLPEMIDSLAEQAAELGGSAGKPVQMIAQETDLPAWNLSKTKDLEVIEALTEKWAVAANKIRAEIESAEEKDPNTGDLLTEVSRQLDKSLWFLESHLHDGQSE